VRPPWVIIGRTARAPCLRSPVSSTLGPRTPIMKLCASVTSSSELAGTVPAMRAFTQASRRTACASALRHQDKVWFCVGTQPRTLQLGDKSSRRSSPCPAAGLPIARLVCSMSRALPLPGSGQHAASVRLIGGLFVLVGKHLGPNLAVNRTRYGMAPWPRSARCPCCTARPGHHAFAGRLPLR
jgi:hypothetical protein